jgi:hypothetical protein
VQDDHGTLFEPETPERQVEQVAVGDERCDVGHGRSVDREQLDLDRPASTTAKDVDAGTRHETSEPGLKPICVAECRQVLPGTKESFLDGVSRELAVPEDQSGRRVQPRDEQGGKLCKGVAIASLCSLDELSLVHVDTFGDGATFVSRSGSMSRRLAKRFPRLARLSRRVIPKAAFVGRVIDWLLAPEPS